MLKAFGKFDPEGERGHRTFERLFEIEGREGSGAWRSRIPCIQKLLDHLRRYTGSEASRERYLNHVLQFCRWAGRDPTELVHLRKKDVETLVQNFVDGLARKGRSKSYVNTVIKRLKTFYRVNGYDDLEIRTYYTPTRYRKVPEHIPSKEQVWKMADSAGRLRDSAIILSLWTSGLRVNTLCALNYGDICDELEDETTPVLVPVYPEMKERVKFACKGDVPYYSFFSEETVDYLKSYLREREEKYDEILPEYPLFHSDWNLISREERTRSRLNRRTVEKIVKIAARHAGIPEWKHITPQALRKAFKSVLRAPNKDGHRLDRGVQQYLMGHILTGSEDYYYDRSDVDFHREAYSKLDFSRGMASSQRDEIVKIDQLEEYLEGGWLFMEKIGEEKVIVRRRS